MNTENAVKIYTPEDDFSFVRPRDIVTPRMLLMQPTSPGVVEGKFRGGEFVLNDSVKIPLQGSAKFVMYMMWLQWIEWNPNRDAPKEEQMLNKSFDPQSTLAKRAEKWELVINSDKKEVPAVTEYYNCILGLPGDDGDYGNLAAFGFARSSHKTGKTLINRLMGIKYNGEKAHMFQTEFLLSSKMEQKGTNRYFVPVVGQGNKLADDRVDEVKNIAEMLRNRRQEMMERIAAQETESGEAPISAADALAKAKADKGEAPF